LWRSGKIAAADYLAHDGQAEDFDRAIRMEPDDESLLAGRAIFQIEEGDDSGAALAALRQAVRINPRDAGALMILGLGAELRGDSGEAERDLAQAAEVDRTFKPVWTLVNFYFRAHQREKFYRAMTRCLSLIERKDLAPVSFDPAPLFDLLWRETDESREILTLIPQREPTLVPYLRYLYATNRTDAGLEAWPEAVRVADPNDPADVDELIRFDEHLITVNRMPEALAAWNVLGAERMAPGFDRGFAWRIPHPQGVSVKEDRGAFQIELDGSEPEDCELIWKYALGFAKLTWNADASDPGLRFEISDESARVLASCPVSQGFCPLEVNAPAKRTRIALKYTRATGTPRLKGSVVLSAVRREQQP
jgi:tetratricopeptide (TPR) repeat protein